MKIDDYFKYDYLENEFTSEEISKNLLSSEQLFANLIKEWNIDRNSEWVIRNYIAIKMILASSVMLSSVQYAQERNLKIVEPYLHYYSLLSCCRAVIYTSPLVEYQNGNIFQLTHKKTINIVGDIISKFNKDKGSDFKLDIDKAREYREIFSYKFPAKGVQDEHLSTMKTIYICSLLCEIAQFQSKILENTLYKKEIKGSDLDWSTLTKGFQYESEHFTIIDDEDYQRLNYISRKQKSPLSLHLMMTEGLVEDFFGAWHSGNDDDSEECYNPNKNWQIIFPVP
jgi:hypothetical protein